MEKEDVILWYLSIFHTIVGTKFWVLVDYLTLYLRINQVSVLMSWIFEGWNFLYFDFLTKHHTCKKSYFDPAYKWRFFFWWIVYTKHRHMFYNNNCLKLKNKIKYKIYSLKFEFATKSSYYYATILFYLISLYE